MMEGMGPARLGNPQAGNFTEGASGPCHQQGKGESEGSQLKTWVMPSTVGWGDSRGCRYRARLPVAIEMRESQGSRGGGPHQPSEVSWTSLP